MSNDNILLGDVAARGATELFAPRPSKPPLRNGTGHVDLSATTTPKNLFSLKSFGFWRAQFLNA